MIAIGAECKNVSLTVNVQEPAAADVTLSVPFVTGPNVATPAQPLIVYVPVKRGSVTITGCASPMELNVKLLGATDSGPGVGVGAGVGPHDVTPARSMSEIHPRNRGLMTALWRPPNRAPFS